MTLDDLPFPLRIFLARPRLSVSLLIGLVSAFLIPDTWVSHPITRGIIGWNISAFLYLSMAAHMMFGFTHERMRRRARRQDEGQGVIIALVILATLLALVAVVAQLSLAKALNGLEQYVHVGLAIITIASTWAFTQVMFALHYAHRYYQSEDKNLPGGLLFPGGHAPDYGDFLYFSCVIGTSGQTADIAIASRGMRRITLLHCVLAFLFNTTILALSINIGASLI